MRTEKDKHLVISQLMDGNREQYKQYLSALEEFFPDTSPSINDDDRMIWFKAGQSSVVGFLKKVYKDNLDNAFER